MKNKVASLLLAVFFLMFFLPNQTTQAAEKRTALVMGNGSYRDSPLKNPVNDARDMAAALKALGFTVDLEVDAGQKTMELAIDAFGKKLRGGGVGLFYFAGHGMQVEGRNYLLPIGSTILAESDVKYEAVDGGRVLDRMNDAENGLNIVILDACRDNPFARSFRSASRGLARMDAPTGSLIVFATAPGSTAADGEGRNGIFTKNLLGNMKAENIPIEKVLKLTRVGVMNETRSRQVPWESSSLTGDFFFARTAGTTLTDSSAATQTRPGGEADEGRPRLEEERRKLEAEYARLVAERKRLEENRGRPDEEGLDIIYDPQTGLEWRLAPDAPASHQEAENWVKSLAPGGGWRMPTQEELKSLYQENAGERNMKPPFKTTGLGVWAAGASGTCFDFKWGKPIQRWNSQGYPVTFMDMRAFAVRKRRSE